MSDTQEWILILSVLALAIVAVLGFVGVGRR